MANEEVDRRAEILNAAVELFGTLGYYGTSLQKIADRVGLTKAGVLHYVGSKEGLLTAALGGMRRRPVPPAHVGGLPLSLCPGTALMYGCRCNKEACMRILLAPDSFKEAASAEAIARAMARGIKRGNPQAECRLMPLSDGGEGLTQALVHATAGTLHNVETVDAIGRPITAQFGFLGNNHASCILHTAVVELASASGLERVSPADRNALSASTFGTGLLIRAAIDAGADCIVLGLGGSATTDGGTGLARALGFRFLDTAGHDIPLGGGSLVDLARIDDSEVPDFVKDVPIVLACDVTNPLTGPEGAAHVFAPQKGANTAQVELLDQGLANLSHAIMQYNGRDIERIPGTGAAGGTGGGMLGLFNTTVRPGIELVLDLAHGREACAWADVVITGHRTAKCRVALRNWRNRKENRLLPSEER